MSRRPPSFVTTLSALMAVVALSLAACAPSSTATSTGLATPGAGDSGAGSAAPAARPSSPAVVRIVEPTNGTTVTGSSVHIVLSLTGAQIVPATTTNIRPDQGHVHLYVDNVLVSMNYALEEDLPVHPGTYVIKAEFVASDHAPFNPRVWSQQVFFTVAQ
jgi:hypothetical protein